MKKSRFTTERIIGFIKQADAGMAVAELGRQHGISSASVYAWWVKYADLALEHHAQKDVLSQFSTTELVKG